MILFSRRLLWTALNKTSFCFTSVIKEQIKLRENALQQTETLMEYKRAFCHHPSHIGAPKKNGGVLSVFVSLLAEPLSRTGTARTDADHLTIELVLHLFRNLLSMDPILHTSAESTQHARTLHHELIHLLERELVLEILLVLAADIEQRENAQYNLLLMELLHHLFRNQDPTSVARSSKRVTAPTTARSGASKGRLTEQLFQERQTKAAVSTSRHSHFGGTLCVARAGGRKQYVSAALVGKDSSAPQASRRKNRKSEPFIGASTVHEFTTMTTTNAWVGESSVKGRDP
jgi:timeless